MNSQSDSVPLREHLEAEIAGLKEWTTAELDARDRALKVKQDADAEALKLSRADQTYKDLKANELREQIGEERAEVARERSNFLNVDDYERRHQDLIKVSEARYASMTKDIRDLSERLKEMEGGNIVKSSTITWALGGLGVVVTIIVVLANLITSGSL
jgi:hypothetical protein